MKKKFLRRKKEDDPEWVRDVACYFFTYTKNGKTDDEFESHIKFFSQPSIDVFKDYGEKIAMTDKAKKMMGDFVDEKENIKKKIFKKLEKITIEIDDEIMNRIGIAVITEMFIERLKLKKEMEKNKIRKDIFEIMVGVMLDNSGQHQVIKEKISQYIG